MDLGLHDRTALVTGAHRGSGEIIARTLAAEGAQVIIHGQQADAARNVAASIDGSQWLAADITNDPGLDALCAAIDALATPIDILVNNFGGSGRGTWWNTGSDDWIEQYRINTLGTVRLSQHLAPQMRQRRFGRIVNLGTVGSSRPGTRMPHYYAAKGALANLTISLARELAADGITVNLLSPGLIRTAEVEAASRARAEREGWGADWSRDIEPRIADNPLGRMATREQVAAAVAFLCSEQAGIITGLNLRLDGGALQIVQ